jgi:diguanylate cyclase (GGDEF)-like protein
VTAQEPVLLELEPLEGAAKPLLESLPFPVMLIDEEYRVVYRNAEAMRTYGSATGTCYELTHGYSQPCDKSGETCPMAEATSRMTAATVCHAHVGANRTVTLHKVVAIPVQGGGILECHIELDDLVSEDSLTRVWGRGFFVRIVERELMLLRRLGMPYAFLVIDLDGLKAVNDSHGHDVGDELLRHAAAILKQTLRKSDAVGRWGGDEFVLFLPSVERTSALALARRKAAAIRRLTVPSADGEIQPTASIGLFWSDRIYDLEVAFRAADRALYSAKHEGGDRVVAASGEPPGAQ